MGAREILLAAFLLAMVNRSMATCEPCSREEVENGTEYPEPDYCSPTPRCRYGVTRMCCHLVCRKGQGESCGGGIGSSFWNGACACDLDCQYPGGIYDFGGGSCVNKTKPAVNREQTTMDYDTTTHIIPITQGITTGTTEHPGCGGVYDTSTGVIRHPMSGGFYQNNENCTWIIRATDPLNISFVSFKTEQNYDNLTLQVGEGNERRLIEIFNGFRIPVPVQINSNIVYLTFRSDHSNPSTGFELRWEASAAACPSPWFLLNNQCLRVVTGEAERRSSASANAYCGELTAGANLVQANNLTVLIDHLQENNFTDTYWLGGTGNGWYGEPCTELWPDNGLGHGVHDLNDWGCMRKMNFICERPYSQD